MSAAECQKTSFDSLRRVFNAHRTAQTLRRDCTDGSQRILDPMMQFSDDKGLQPLRRLPLLRVDACLLQEKLRVHSGLFEQSAKRLILLGEVLCKRRGQLRRLCSVLCQLPDCQRDDVLWKYLQCASAYHA